MPYRLVAVLMVHCLESYLQYKMIQFSVHAHTDVQCRNDMYYDGDDMRFPFLLPSVISYCIVLVLKFTVMTH